MNESILSKIGLPRLIITALFVFVLVVGVVVGLPMNMLVGDTLQRFGMFGILVLAMVPSIQSGTGPNFALPIGIITGLLGLVISVEFNLTGLVGFIGAFLFSLPLSLIIGYYYGKLLNAVKGSEMAIATYMGFSAVQLMSIGWITLPFKSEKMIWPIGDGLRNTFTLKNNFAGVLDNIMSFEIMGVFVPTGLIAFFLITCFIVYIFTKTKAGTSIRIGGMNPYYAEASGVNHDKGRILANIISTVLASLGIIVYSSSFGFVQLYTAPMMMAFPAVAAILIGGATAKRASISNVLVGVFLFQGLLTISLPVANEVFPQSNISEIIRMIVQNGVILYALTKVKGGR